ncbi:MAG: M17 family peptidase N-terminal domain-containing protein [Nitrospira sp.]|nr:hypothetical protein [Candidatus Manganitrophaceae bacterium]HIL34498.1 hypothetical protein [Candidatus Manganitrophaceae bacterium]
MQINLFSGKLSKLRSEVLVVSCFEDVRPLGGMAGEIDWLYGGIISGLMMQNKMTGRLGEVLLVAPQDKLQVSKIILVGLGTCETYSYPQIKSVARRLYHSINGLNVRERAVELFVPENQALDLSLLMESFLTGWRAEAKAMGKKKEFNLTFVIKEGEGAKRLQQKILNDRNLLKGNYSPESRAITGPTSYSFS